MDSPMVLASDPFSVGERYTQTDTGILQAGDDWLYSVAGRYFICDDYDLDVRNGQRAMVDQVTPKGIIDIVLDNGESKKINVHKYNHMEYGWAATTHKAQGATVDRAIVYGFSKESMASQQATYVQISRAREETKLYVVAGERGIEREEVSRKMNAEQRQKVIAEMKREWSHNAAKDTTLEYKVLKQEKEHIDNRCGVQSEQLAEHQAPQHRHPQGVSEL